jgi:hypothetical protein
MEATARRLFNQESSGMKGVVGTATFRLGAAIQLMPYRSNTYTNMCDIIGVTQA